MRTQKQIEANYTELIHAGEGIEIEKGKISATGGSGGPGGFNLIPLTYNEVGSTLSFEGSLIKSESLNVLRDYDGVNSYFYLVTAIESDYISCVTSNITNAVVYQFRPDGTGKYVYAFD